MASFRDIYFGVKAAPFTARNVRWFLLSRALIAVRNELAADRSREMGRREEADAGGGVHDSVEVTG